MAEVESSFLIRMENIKPLPSMATYVYMETANASFVVSIPSESIEMIPLRVTEEGGILIQRPSPVLVSDNEDIYMAAAEDNHFASGRSNESPFIYVDTLSTKLAETKDQVTNVKGKIKHGLGPQTCVTFLMSMKDMLTTPTNCPIAERRQAHSLFNTLKKKQVTSHVFEPTDFFANMNNKKSSGGRKDNRSSSNENMTEFKNVCKKIGKIAAQVNSGFDEHFNGDSLFDIGYENEVRMNQGGNVDSKLVQMFQQMMLGQTPMVGSGFLGIQGYKQHHEGNVNLQKPHHHNIGD
ncbi:hypothetical protein Tco_0001357 [Tanacetum coccineum]